jgi:hypothetical protein
MTLRKATVRKEGDQVITEYETNAIPTIEGKGTKKHPDIKVDIGMRLEPTKVTYPADKYTLQQILEGTKERLETGECEMCEREQQLVSLMVSSLYAVKDEAAKRKQEVPKPPEKIKVEKPIKGPFGLWDFPVVNTLEAEKKAG